VVPEASPASPHAARLLSRDAELAQLQRFLDGGAGSPACLTLLGEPGVGKTTLWEAGLSLAVAGGHAALSARASEAEARLSFAALGDLVDGVGDEVLEELPPPHRRAIEVAVRRVDAGSEPPDKLAICAGFLGALRLLAARRQLIVAVDDVQWLDASSADVLLFAARRVEAGTRFLLSRRAGRPSDLERVLEVRGVERVELAGLSTGAIARLLAERLGVVPPRRVLRRLYETSHGNPLFALELGRLLAEQGPPEPGVELPFPQLVEEVFGARVRALGPEVRRLLLAVALSAGVTRAELEQVVDPHAVEDAESAGVLAVQGGHVRAEHGLLAATARHLSSGRERADLHRQLAAVVADPAQRALHLALASRAPDEELAAVIAAASLLALETGSAPEGEELARHALRLTPADSAARPSRVLELVDAELATGDLLRAGATIAAHLEGLPAGRSRARGYLAAARTSDFRDEPAFIELALAEAGDDPEVVADALRRKSLRLSIVLVQQLDVAEALARDALVAARGAGPEVEERVLPALAWSLVIQGRPVAELALTDLDRLGGSFERSVARPLAVRLAFRGETAEARSFFRRLARAAEERGLGKAVVALVIQRCELELRCGDVLEVERLFGELDQWASVDDISAVQARVRALEAAVRGDPAEAARWAGRVLASVDPEASPMWDRLECERALGIAALFSQEANEAVTRLGRVWEHAKAHHVGDPGAFPVAGDLVEALLLAGDATAAESVTEALARDAHERQHPWGLATADRCAALLALRRGYDEASARRLEVAASAYGNLGLAFERARCLLALGRLQRRSKKSGAARRSLEAAAGEFERLGCSGWSEAAGEELSRISGRRRSADGQLTPSERRVVDLAARGLTNKEIAAELFVSVYTVEDHLSHAYAKLGVRSRAQLARLAALE